MQVESADAIVVDSSMPKLSLELNIDVEIIVTAKIHGDLQLSLL